MVRRGQFSLFELLAKIKQSIARFVRDVVPFAVEVQRWPQLVQAAA